MRIAVAFDHAGFPLKQTILNAVRSAGHELIDLGTDSTDSGRLPGLCRQAWACHPGWRSPARDIGVWLGCGRLHRCQ